MDYALGQPIITTGRNPEDSPDIGEVRPIIDALTGMTLAWYRVIEVIQPALVGWVAIVHAQICEEPQI